MSSRVARRRDRRKAEIVRAATRLLSEHGYHGMNLEDVAEQTDIAKGTLYHIILRKGRARRRRPRGVTSDVNSRLEAQRTWCATAATARQLRALIREQVRILTETAPEVVTVFSWPPKSWPEASDETGFKWFVPGPVDGSVAFDGERRVVRRSLTHLARIQREARKIVDSAFNASN